MGYEIKKIRPPTIVQIMSKSVFAQGEVNELSQWCWPKKFAQIRTRSVSALGSPSSPSPSPSHSHPPTLLDPVSDVAMKPSHQ